MRFGGKKAKLDVNPNPEGSALEMKRILRRLCMLLALALLLPTALPVPAARAASDTPKLIALTFDDGPSAYTEGLLDTLEQRGAAATFFMCET